MKFNHFIPMRSLQLFAEGAGDSGTASETGATGTAAVSQKTGAKGNPLAGVKYGIQEETAPAAEVQKEQTPPDLNAEFEELIKGKYKDSFDSRVQSIVQKRLKGSKETADRLTAQQPLMDMLAKRYGVKDAGDIEALIAAVEEDGGFLEEEAMKRGMSVEQYKVIRAMEKEQAKTERENIRLKNQMQEQERQARYTSWLNQAEELKAVYPSFDIRTELENPQFRSLLQSNIPVRTAYEVIHKDDIISGAMQFTARTVEQKLANSVVSGRARPDENGNSNQGAATVKSDVSKLTKADRQEIARRVARGEKIRF